jgi:hypothetical protein
VLSSFLTSARHVACHMVIADMRICRACCCNPNPVHCRSVPVTHSCTLHLPSGSPYLPSPRTLPNPGSLNGSPPHQPQQHCQCSSCSCGSIVRRVTSETLTPTLTFWRGPITLQLGSSWHCRWPWGCSCATTQALICTGTTSATLPAATAAQSSTAPSTQLIASYPSSSVSCWCAWGCIGPNTDNSHSGRATGAPEAPQCWRARLQLVIWQGLRHWWYCRRSRSGSRRTWAPKQQCIGSTRTRAGGRSCA